MVSGFSFSGVSSHFFSPQQREKIENTVIGIAGAGGIGSNLAIMLVRSGFSRFVVADFDVVTISNLNRQAYTPAQLGRIKVDCLQEICTAINPDLAMETHPVRVDRSNARGLFSSCDILFEAFDDAAAKAMLFSEFMAAGKLLIGVSGIAGTGKSDEIVIRKIHHHCFMVGDAVSAVGGTIKPHAPRVMVAAAKMADIALDRVLHPDEAC
jgi:sulfur carrier protein ThiS adenylyltransferase